jgi:hypothetical protein
MMTRRHSSAFQLLSDFDADGHIIHAPDFDAQLKQAFDDGFQQGYAGGRTEADADAELRLAELQSLHDQSMASERANWRQECADVLASGLDDAIRSIEANIETRLAVILRPWLEEKLRDRALKEFQETITRALSQGANIQISGPAQILDSLRERLPSSAIEISYTENSGPGVIAHIDDTQIDADFSAWIAQLEQAIS